MAECLFYCVGLRALPRGVYFFIFPLASTAKATFLMTANQQKQGGKKKVYPWSPKVYPGLKPTTIKYQRQARARRKQTKAKASKRKLKQAKASNCKQKQANSTKSKQIQGKTSKRQKKNKPKQARPSERKQKQAKGNKCKHMQAKANKSKQQ